MYNVFVVGEVDIQCLLLYVRLTYSVRCCW